MLKLNTLLAGLIFTSLAFAVTPPNPADPTQTVYTICDAFGMASRSSDLRLCIEAQQKELENLTGDEFAIFATDTVADVATVYSITNQEASDALYAGGTGSGGGN